MAVERGYEVAMLDWLACAVGGSGEPAASAAREAATGLGGRVAALGVAGHVLDFDDTYLPGLAHLSATTAPAALAVAADRGASVGEVLEAFAGGFEAMGALARAGHPALYDGGWHPTAVCGSVGAAVCAARLSGLGPAEWKAAVGFALLRSAGLRSSFGSDGKAIGVGLAAASGVEGAALARGGARIDLDRAARGPGGYQEAFGARFALRGESPAVAENWIKAYPCCLQTHGAIEAAVAARESGVNGHLRVVLHPLSLQAAPIAGPTDGLEAKFSIPYLTAFALLRGAPGPADFAAVDGEVALFASEHVEVVADDGLLESEARLEADGDEVARVEAALGSPLRPMTEDQLAAKRRALAGDRLEGALEDRDRPAAELLARLGL
ncbi:MAG TPA: MmgE/PrpD family protein [Solirubrobacterales bacterium]|nr:MmgE/PrpD family protein [Solirubrobacterales bacterium]